MQTKYKNVTEQEFRVIRALAQTHKTAEVARITGRSYPVVKRAQSVENFDEYRSHKPAKPVKSEAPYMDQMIVLLTEIRDELKRANAAKKKGWF